MTFLSALLLALFITVTLIPLLKTAALRYNAVDMPNERKMHLHPIPRVGGVAMAAGILLPVIFWAPMNGFGHALLSGAGIIAAFALLDDVINLGYRPKFAGQILAALCVVIFGDLQVRSLGSLLPPGTILPPMVAIPLTCFLIVAATNAINLADGLDGLAGGISLLMFICIGFISYGHNLILSVFVSVAVAGAIFGFLRYNTHPAVIFMGDTGSQLLGFLAMCLSIWISQSVDGLNKVLPLVLLGFPFIDTLVVMTERILRGVSPFKADKNHLHHKLMRLGLYQSEAVVAVYLHQAFLVLAAFVFRYASEGFLLSFYLVFACLVITGSTVSDRMGWKIPRFDLVDRVIKGRLRKIREQALLIKVAFKTIEIITPALLWTLCLLVKSPPTYFAVICLGMGITMTVAAVFRKPVLSDALRFSLYICLPFIVFQCTSGMQNDLPLLFRHFFNIMHGALTFFVILTLKLTRRRRGFRVTPMDFLVLFLAVSIPYIPDSHVQSMHMGIVTTRVIVVLFSYEVLIGELRGQVRGQTLAAAGAFILVAVRGLLL